MSKLNEKQHKFCLEYVKTGNATQSYINAGYSKNGAEVSASQLLRNPKVEEFIKKHQEKAEEKNIIDLEYLTKGYMELIEMHKDTTPNVAKGCFDSLAKMYGHDGVQKVEHSGKMVSIEIMRDDGKTAN